ncbi:hypothetical protein BH24ACT4_BH24ACT4_24580 [soil metagenome]
MTRRTVALLAVLLALVVLVGCGSDDDASDDGSGGPADPTTDAPGDTTGERIDLGATEALTWGDGPQGVVLAHGSAFDAASWEVQATAIADQGAAVVSVEETSTEGIEAAVDHLRDQEGVEQVILMGGSSGADAILDLASTQPDLPDGLILLSPNSTVEGLGEEPKLFVASEEEGVADVSTELAASAPGDDNEALILPGSDHAQNIFDGDQADALTEAILAQLRQLAG